MRAAGRRVVGRRSATGARERSIGGAASTGVLALPESPTTMPTILRTGPYRLYFFSHEPNEPPHVHIDRDNATAKFWLRPVRLASGAGFSWSELRRLERLVQTHQQLLSGAWHDYFEI